MAVVSEVGLELPLHYQEQYLVNREKTNKMQQSDDNKHLIVAYCWFSLSSHFAHDARSQEPKEQYRLLKKTVVQAQR